MRVAKDVVLYGNTLVIVDNLGGVWYGYYEGDEEWAWHKVPLPDNIKEWTDRKEDWSETHG